MCLAIPGKLVEITNEATYERAGKVDFGGVLKEVNLSCVPEAQLGDYLTVHVGFAIGVVDEAEARQVVDYLRQMGEMDALEESR